MAQEGSLQSFNQELFSSVRRAINSLREKEMIIRKKSLQQLLTIVKKEVLTAAIFEEILHMGLKDFIKCYYDSSEANRQNSIHLTIQLLSRCKNIQTFLPYIFQALKDRTNCVDLQGIDKIPQKMRPQPGQKPKVIVKLVQNCEQIRLLYCNLLKRIFFLLDKDKHEMLKHLDDSVNILRALIMDPAPEVQKAACETLQMFCQDYSDLLLHFTETMGRAVLAPLVSKKSKIRIAALNTLTSILWCGLWKYNAFVFQNLIGFRDPNSVPIKDFYEPNNNINYLATFIIDSNPRVRKEFLKHVKIWICDLNDKYDHHAKIVPYLLSGLFDEDEEVKNTALQTLQEIGKQVEVQKQKQLRENKQFAIDAAWTWEKKLVHLPIEEPLKSRPSIGSRYFVRGHVRKFWNALYKQIRDIKEQNKVRSVNLALYGVIYTENYMTQYLDNLIPQFLPSIIPISHDDKYVSDKMCKIFYYIGRYCEQSGYIHLMKSALDGTLIQNQEFVRCAMKGLSMLIKGNLQAIPQNQHLCHKKTNILQLLNIIETTEISGDVYNFNCIQARQIAVCILQGIFKNANQQEKQQIFTSHYLTILKMLAVSYYQELYASGFSWKKSQLTLVDQTQQFQPFIQTIQKIQKVYPNTLQNLGQYLNYVQENPPTLMDSDWKILIILYRYLSTKEMSVEFQQIQDNICSCISQNQSVDLLMFSFKYIYNLVFNFGQNKEGKAINNSGKFIKYCLRNLTKFKPMKKVPVYDQHLVKPDNEPNLFKTSEENYVSMFLSASSSVSSYLMKKIVIKNSILAEILSVYIEAFKKIKKGRQSLVEAVKTVWVVFERVNIEPEFANQFSFNEKENHFMIPDIIDFCIERIEENPDQKIMTMVFSILQRILKCWPKLKVITEKIINIYPDYPELLDKLFKYCLNEKDVEIKQKYVSLLTQIGKKMPDWFKHQADMAKQSNRYEKHKMIKEIIYQANI